MSSRLDIAWFFLHLKSSTFTQQFSTPQDSCHPYSFASLLLIWSRAIHFLRSPKNSFVYFVLLLHLPRKFSKMRRLEIVFHLYFKKKHKGLQFQRKGTIESLRSISTNLKVTILSHRFMVDCQIVVRKKESNELLKESVTRWCPSF